MKLGLINSAWAQAGRDTAYGIRMTKEIGFDTIDIFTDPLDIDIRERRLIKQLGGRHPDPRSQQAIRGRITRRLLVELAGTLKEKKR